MDLVTLPSLPSRVGLLPAISTLSLFHHPPPRPRWSRGDPGDPTLSPIESRATPSHLYPLSSTTHRLDPAGVEMALVTLPSLPSRVGLLPVTSTLSPPPQPAPPPSRPRWSKDGPGSSSTLSPIESRATTPSHLYLKNGKATG